jgi:hypothetical protein
MKLLKFDIEIALAGIQVPADCYFLFISAK